MGLLAWLGKEVGISVDHLSRLTSADATRLREVFDAWRMVLATVVWMEEGSWERAAWRLGYKGPSGVTALARRTLGRCPQELSRDPGQVLALAEARIMGLVAGPGERKSDGVNECGIG